MPDSPSFEDVRHEVVKEDDTGRPLLHVYLPEGLTASDVDVTTINNADNAEVFIEHVETGCVIGMITLEEYRVNEDDGGVAKYSKKHRRFTIRLLNAEPKAADEPGPETPAEEAAEPAAPAAAVESSDSPASPVQPRPVSPPPSAPAPPAAEADAAPAAADNTFGVLENDEVSDDEDVAEEGGAAAAAAAAGKKKKKKKKKGKKGGAGAEAGAGTGEGGEGEQAEAGVEAPAPNGDAAPRGGEGSSGGQGQDGKVATAAASISGEGATGGAKKKKKKKKKGGAGAAGTAGAGAEGEDTEEGEAEAAAAAGVEAHQEVGGNAAEVEAEEAALPGRTSPPPEAAPTPSEAPSAPDSAPDSLPLSKAASRALSVSVDMEEDFRGPAVGSFEVERRVEPHDPLLGPAVHHGMGKVQVKGEDRWLEAPSNTFTWEGLEDFPTPVSAFGIFDGHGGRMAAQHAARALLPLVGGFSTRAAGSSLPAGAGELAEAGYLGQAQQGEGGEGGEADEAAVARAQVAAVQDALLSRLPKALHAGFVQCDEEVVSRHKTSGTTATLAVQVGWELLVANVGDSLAYLDTGSEIVVISANHRVAENTEEQQRIVSAGGRIKPAKYEEDEDGPAGTATPHEGLHLRVWPGGINMTRTIGDDSAKGLLIPEPAVRQISLPVTGARLIIASDGLWDAVNAKTTIGQLRTMTAREAASRAAVLALRNKKHEDDVTVVVADFVPRQADTHVPGLLKRASGPAAVAAVALAAAGMKEERAAQAWRPLETPSTSWRDRHRAHRQRAAAYLQQLTEAEAAEVEAAEALERQRRMAVAPAAGTAGAGTAIRPQPMSDTYRELADLRIENLDQLWKVEPAAETEAAAGGEDWTTVDHHPKKKDAGGGFNLQRELLKAARPGEGRAQGGGQAEGGGRRERRGGPRREREGTQGQDRPSGADGVECAAAAPAEEPATNDAGVAQQQARPQRPPRRDRREPRGTGGAAGGRGPRGEAGAATEAPAGGSAAAAPLAPPGVVRAGEYLYVPRSLLTGGAQTPAAAAAGGSASAPAADAAGGEGGGGGKPRRERPPKRPSRRESPSASGAAAHDVPPATDDREAAPAEAPATAGTSRRVQHNRKHRAAAEAAATAAMGGLPTARPAAAAPTPAAPAATPSSDPAAEVGSAQERRHRQPPKQPQPAAHPAGSEPAAGQQSAPAGQRPQPQAQAPHDPRYTLVGTTAHQRHAGARPAATAASHAPAAAASSHQQQQHPPSQQAPPRQQQQQHDSYQQHQRTAPQAAAAAAAAAPAAAPAPTYTGPMDFGAGFGSGGGSWQPPSAPGQYGGIGAAPGGGAASSAVPQRPAGLAPVTGFQGPRDPQEVAAAAAAAAAAAVARKVAAGRGGGPRGAGAPGGGAGRGYSAGRG